MAYNLLYDEVAVLIGVLVLVSESITQLIFLLHNTQWQSVSNAEKDKQRPLESKEVNHDDENKPVNEFRVRKEIEGFSRSQLLEKAGHINPFLHPICAWSREWIDREHQKQSCVDANTIITNGANRIDVRAVIGANTGIIR